MEDEIDHSVGFVIGTRLGDLVRRGEPLGTVFARDHAGVALGMAVLEKAIVIEDEADLPLPLVSHRVSVAGAEAYDEDTLAERVVHNE
jgi:pyrimidine-nucleoside phosphorylase